MKYRVSLTLAIEQTRSRIMLHSSHTCNSKLGRFREMPKHQGYKLMSGTASTLLSNSTRKIFIEIASSSFVTG